MGIVAPRPLGSCPATTPGNNQIVSGSGANLCKSLQRKEIGISLGPPAKTPPAKVGEQPTAIAATIIKVEGLRPYPPELWVLGRWIWNTILQHMHDVVRARSCLVSSAVVLDQDSDACSVLEHADVCGPTGFDRPRLLLEEDFPVFLPVRSKSHTTFVWLIGHLLAHEIKSN